MKRKLEGASCKEEKREWEKEKKLPPPGTTSIQTWSSPTTAG
jgi:hypothetical protein